MKMKDIKALEEAMEDINNALNKFTGVVRDTNIIMPKTDLDIIGKLMDKVPGSTVEYSEYGDHNGLNCYFAGDSGDSELVVCFWFDVNTGKLIKVTGQNI